MAHLTDPNVFETANAGFAQVMYEEFLRDPASVAPEWRELFEAGRTGMAPSPGAGNGGRGDHAPSNLAPPAVSASPPPAAAQGGGVPLKGPAARLAQNMTESLTVPTATTFREISVRSLEAARAELNQALKGAGRGEKASFTHFIAWALVQAAKRHPVMTSSFTVIEGSPQRVQPDGIGLGLAVDIERKDGSRGLVVPVLKHAERMSYLEFHSAYDAVVEKARHNKLMPDDFAGGS